jgi:hypothetical protein
MTHFNFLHAGEIDCEQHESKVYRNGLRSTKLQARFLQTLQDTNAQVFLSEEYIYQTNFP